MLWLQVLYPPTPARRGIVPSAQGRWGGLDAINHADREKLWLQILTPQPRWGSFRRRDDEGSALFHRENHSGFFTTSPQLIPPCLTRHVDKHQYLPEIYSCCPNSGAKRPLEDVQGFINDCVGHSQRSHDPNHVSISATRQKKQTLLFRLGNQRLGKIWCRLAPLAVVKKLKREHQAKTAHLANCRIAPSDLLHPSLHPRTKPLAPF